MTRTLCHVAKCKTSYLVVELPRSLHTVQYDLVLVYRSKSSDFIRHEFARIKKLRSLSSEALRRIELVIARFAAQIKRLNKATLCVDTSPFGFREYFASVDLTAAFRLTVQKNQSDCVSGEKDLAAEATY